MILMSLEIAVRHKSERIVMVAKYAMNTGQGLKSLWNKYKTFSSAVNNVLYVYIYILTVEGNIKSYVLKT